MQRIVDPGDPCDILVLPMMLTEAEDLNREAVSESAIAAVLGAIDEPSEEA